MNLHEQNITVFDCEIQNEVDGKIIGWKNYDKMGHAVSASYNFKSGNYKIYFNDNLDELADDLHSSDLVTGFNIKGFDIPLLNGTAELIKKISLDEKKIYDMLEESRKSVGNFFAKGLKLDNHLESMFGAGGMKSGHGANAPKLWQDKKLGSLCSYVLRDVNREKALFEHIWQHGWVNTAMHGQKQVKKPQDQLTFQLGF